MQRRWLGTVGCIAVLVLLAGGLAGAVGADVEQDDDFPRAEAGLDQTVEQNASVLLDGSESFSPSGELVAYEWAIETPNGSTTTPNCDSPDCSRARFRVPELGQYNVTLTVTDDDGRERSDTLYVTVVPRGDFGVTLTGPGSTGSDGNLTATVAPGDVAAQNITWYRDGEPLGNRSLPATGGTFNRSAFIAPGSSYRAVVNGSWNRTASDTWTAPGGASTTFVPDNAGEYPRIEGPAVVTGDPDHRGTTWRFDSTAYVLRTSQFGSVRLSTWEIPGARGATDWYVRDESLVRPPLEPGPNRIRTDVEVQLGDAVRTSGEAVNESRPEVHDVNLSERLTRRVIVDPAPQIDSFEVMTGPQSIDISYDWSDPYNPAQEIQVLVDGVNQHSDQIGNSGHGLVSVPIPPGTYGETSVQLRIIDGRGQVAADQGIASLPSRSPNPSDSSDMQGTAFVFNEEEDRIEGRQTGRPVLKET
jgi:hypothetical protein